MIIFKLISTRLKKHLGSRCSNFYFNEVKTKKKLKKIKYNFFSNSRDLNEAPFN